MDSLLTQVLQVFLVSQFIFFLACPAHAQKMGATLEDLNFTLNTDFMANKEACVIPRMRSSFVIPEELARFPDSLEVGETNRWVRRLQDIQQHLVIGGGLNYLEGRWQRWSHAPLNKHNGETDRQLDQQWQRESELLMKRSTAWREEFILKHKDILKRGKGLFTCVILDRSKRLQCCTSHMKRRKHEGEKLDFNVKVCMAVVQKYCDVLKMKGVMLSSKDEDQLYHELFEVVRRVGVNGSDQHINGTSESGKDKRRKQGSGKDDGRKERQRKSKKWEQENKKKLKGGQAPQNGTKETTQDELVNLLVAMKRIEHIILSQQSGYVHSSDKRVFYLFLEAFANCYKQNKTAVFYHAVEERWLTCGSVRMDTNVAAYCSDLAAVDTSASEVARRPILNWESGALEPIREYVEGETDSLETISRKALVEEDEYVTVDLLSSPCSGADLSFSCHAMCCDTVYGVSYFCETKGLVCIG